METALISLVIIVVIAGSFWMMRSQPAARPRHGRPVSSSSATARPGGLEKLKSNNFFWGVKIGKPGCPAAQRLQNKQFTFEEAPDLPVPGCDAAHCTCQFIGLRDRRSRNRRIQEDRREEVRFDMNHRERRSGNGRRRSDKWKNHPN